MDSKIRQIHMVGIGGAGMSGIAEVLLNLGYDISGSDMSDSAVVKHLRQSWGPHRRGPCGRERGQRAGAVKSTAIAEDNPKWWKRAAATSPSSPCRDAGRTDAPASGVAIAGTHGKTTTTSLTASIFDTAGLDPTVIIGGRLNVYGTNAHLGSGHYLIAEADESDGSFLCLFPIINVVTNVDEDHLDHYGTRQAIDDAFERLYPGQLPEHYGTNLHARAMFGGNEYLDGFSFYTSPKGYKHLVTYGMTVLYGDEDAFGGTRNGWGYEMTMKLAEKDVEECLWAVSTMSNLARYTYTSGRPTLPGTCIRGDGSPLRIGSDSLITALLLVDDTEAEPQTSVYGETRFVQLVGITAAEAQAIADDRDNAGRLVELMRADGNVDLVTDMRRTASYL